MFWGWLSPYAESDVFILNRPKLICSNSYLIAFSALTLLVGRQEGHPACKKTEWWDVGVVIWDEVQTCI